MRPVGLSTRSIEAFNQRDGEVMWSMLDEQVANVVGGNLPSGARKRSSSHTCQRSEAMSAPSPLGRRHGGSARSAHEWRA